jgi:hypothetical protein
VEPEHELTLGQRAKIGFQGSVAVARNPKMLIALVKYKLSERKQRRAQPDPINSTDRI